MTAPAEPTGLVKIPARDITVMVETATAGTWVEVSNLTAVTPNPAENEQTADTTTNDDNGAYSQRIMQRGASITLEGYKVKNGTGAEALGQARLEELAAGVGEGSVGKIRFAHPSDTQWKVWSCTVSGGTGGGGINDMTGWSVTCVRDGVATTAAKP